MGRPEASPMSLLHLPHGRMHHGEILIFLPRTMQRAMLPPQFVTITRKGARRLMEKCIEGRDRWAPPSTPSLGVRGAAHEASLLGARRAGGAARNSWAHHLQGEHGGLSRSNILHLPQSTHHWIKADPVRSRRSGHVDHGFSYACSGTGQANHADARWHGKVIREDVVTVMQDVIRSAKAFGDLFRKCLSNMKLHGKLHSLLLVFFN